MCAQPPAEPGLRREDMREGDDPESLFEKWLREEQQQGAAFTGAAD